MSDATRPSPTIEVGASDIEGSLRYWRAKEAVRQGEARLTAQATIRTALEARATAIAGWAAASLVVVTGAVFATAQLQAIIAGGTTSLVLFCSAGLCIYAARPRDWSMTGYDPSIITGTALATELEILEAVAGGISPGIQANNVRLNEMSALLRGSGWLLLAAPIVGAATYGLALAIAS